MAFFKLPNLFNNKGKAGRQRHLPFSPKLRITDENGPHKLAELLRHKVKKALSINYEFTPNEMKQAFKQRKFPKRMAHEIIKTLSLLEGVQYAGKELSEREEESLLSRLGKLLAQLDKRISVK